MRDECARRIRARIHPTKKAGFSAGLVACVMNSNVQLAGRLAAAGNADLFLEVVETDGADHDLLADHVARSAVHAHRFGELEVLLEGGTHFGTGDVLLDSCGVEA